MSFILGSLNRITDTQTHITSHSHHMRWESHKEKMVNCADCMRRNSGEFPLIPLMSPSTVVEYRQENDPIHHWLLKLLSHHLIINSSNTTKKKLLNFKNNEKIRNIIIIIIAVKYIPLLCFKIWFSFGHRVLLLSI